MIERYWAFRAVFLIFYVNRNMLMWTVNRSFHRTETRTLFFLLRITGDDDTIDVVSKSNLSTSLFRHALHHSVIKIDIYHVFIGVKTCSGLVHKSTHSNKSIKFENLRWNYRKEFNLIQKPFNECSGNFEIELNSVINWQVADHYRQSLTFF